MKAGKAILNFDTFTATFFDEEVDMVEVGTGHVCISLLSDHIESHVNDKSCKREIRGFERIVQVS